MIKYIIPVLAFGALAFAATGKKLLKLEPSIASLRYKSSSLDKLLLLVDLDVYNPNKSKSLTINAFKFQLYYRNQKLGTILQESLDIPVEPKKTAKLKNISLYINLLNTLDNLFDILMGDHDKAIKVTGYLMADGLKIPLEDTIELTQA